MIGNIVSILEGETRGTSFEGPGIKPAFLLLNR